jgi:hypothetical protein
VASQDSVAGAADTNAYLLPSLGGLSVFVAIALGATRFHFVPTADGPWRGISDPPHLARILCAAAAGLLTMAALKRRPSRVAEPFLFLLLAAAPLLPLITGRGVLAVVFQRPVLALVEAAVVAVVAVRSLRVPAPKIRPMMPLLFAAGFLFHSIVGPRLAGSAGAQGDEPHYLLMCESLLKDGDLDLANQYPAHPSLTPHVSSSSLPGHMYSWHTPGLPIVLLPAYALGGYVGVQMFLAAVTALTGALVYRLVRNNPGGEWVALALWALVTLTPPLGIVGTRIYPETIATLGCAVFLLAGRRDATIGDTVAAAILAAGLPWLHSKFAILGAAGLAISVWRSPHRRLRWASAALFVISMVSLLAFFHHLYGSASLSAPIYGRGGLPAANSPGSLSLLHVPRGLGGLFFDRVFGLFVVAPVWFLSLPAFWHLVRRERGDASRIALIVVSVIGVAAAFDCWWAGVSVPARYCVPIIPALALALAAVLPARGPVVAALGATQFGLVLLGLTMPSTFHVLMGGESILFRALSPYVDLGGLFPSFFDVGPKPMVLAVLLTATGIAAWRYGWKGFVLGGVAYGLALGVGGHRTLVSAREATLELLMKWEPAERTVFGAVPRLASLDVPLDLPPPPWELRPGAFRRSRILEVPPGRYRVQAEVGFVGIGPASVAVEIYDDTLKIAELRLDRQTLVSATTLSLPAGAQRLRASAIGLKGAAQVTGIHLIPETVVPLSERGAIASAPS